MISKKMKFIACLMVIEFLVAGYIFYLSIRPVKIITINQRNNHTDILITALPLTEKGRIEWWLVNINSLRERYNIPQPAEDGSYSMVFWNFDDDFKEDDGYDRVCFKEIKSELNCVDKDSLMMVEYGPRTGLYFRMDSGEYFMQKNGEMIKKSYGE